jgi:hypothetical protein
MENKMSHIDDDAGMYDEPTLEDYDDGDDRARQGVAQFHARLRAAEQDTRSLRASVRWVALLLGIGLGVSFLASTEWPLNAIRGADASVIEASRVVLVGPDGEPRGEWFVDEDGNARLALLDQQAQERLLLTVRDGGFPGISLSNAEGQRRVALGLLPDETTSLVFADGGGIPRAVLGLTRGESANLVFADGDGVSRVGLGLNGNGIGSVMLPSDR